MHPSGSSRKANLVLASILISLPFGAASAQDDSDSGIVIDTAAQAAANAPATVGDVDDARKSTLILDEWINRTLERTIPKTSRPLNLSGNISTRYTYIQGKQATPYYNSFNIPNVSLGFKGILFKDYENSKNLTYSLGFSSANGGAPTVADANIGYSLLSTVDLRNPSLNISIGQQKKPWGQEAQADAEAQPSVSGSTYLSSVGVSDVSARDIGVVIKGDILPTVDYGYNYRAPLLAVSAGFFNGAGANVSADNNRDKEWVVRAVLAPPVGYYNFLRGLTIGASFAKSEKNIIAAGGVLTPAKTIWLYKTNSAGTKTDSGKVTVADAVKAPSDTISGDRTRLGIDISYIRTPVNLTVEGVYATQDSVYWDKVTKSFSPYHRRSWGGSVTLFLNIGEQFLKGYREQARPDDWWPITWQPFFRIDGFDPDDDIRGRWDTTYVSRGAAAAAGAWQLVGTVGGNVFFARTTKLQVNYRWKKTEDFPAKFHETLVQLSYGF